MTAGRPPKYKTAKELQGVIDDYFENGVVKRIVIVGKGDTAKEIKIPVPTITGLVLHCGFCDRSSFYDLEKQEKFSYTIKRSRTMIAKLYEESLQGNSVAGPIFALKNLGWSDQTDLKISGDGNNPLVWNVNVVKAEEGD